MAQWAKTGAGVVDFEAVGVSAVVAARTGGAILGLEAGGVSEVILGEVGVSYGGPAWVEDEGLFHVRTGRARLELVASGRAVLDVDELARMLEENRLVAEGVI